MKKILILTIGFDGGGSGKMAALMENFLNKSYDTTTVVFYDDTGVFKLKGKKININIFPNSHFPGIGYIAPIPHIISTIKYIKKEKPDIVVAVGTYCNFLGLFAKKFLNFKLLLTQHEHITSRKRKDSMLSSYNLIFYMIKKLIRNNKIVCVSEEVKKDTIKQYCINENQAITIYNGLDFSRIQYLCDKPTPLKNKYIINIGSLDNNKNQEMLIKAYSKTKCKNEYKLLLIGKGPQRQHLEELTKELNLEENVIFLGFQENPYKYLSKASLFCFTSKSESFGLVLVESLILKVPVLTVPVSGAKEVLNNGDCGYIVDNWDIDNFAKKIDEVINKDNSYIIQKGISFSKNNFSIEKMMNKYLNILNLLLHQS